MYSLVIIVIFKKNNFLNRFFENYNHIRSSIAPGRQKEVNGRTDDITKLSGDFCICVNVFKIIKSIVKKYFFLRVEF
jgi:hypothetical protein